MRGFPIKKTYCGVIFILELKMGRMFILTLQCLSSVRLTQVMLHADWWRKCTCLVKKG